ncbi:MAG: protein kinase [Planctomycetia bacterium]|nr:protein kinase [Planctomycetia bacterium]
MQPSPAAADMVPVEQFLKGLGESGLLPAADVRALAQRYAQGDARALAQELIRQQKLTPYQASMLGRGRSRGLVLANTYIVLEKLGQGGMGMVFKAHDRRMDRTVAVKVLPPAFTKKPHAVQRFQREVQAAARLVHPNIVASFDAGQDVGAYFLVMEFVDGSDLSRLVKTQGPLPVAQAVNCALQAARGLEHAHAAGVIHRDIKPGNLLLDRKGTVKILDMGLARFDESANNPGAADELTHAGSVLGTCDYMAPEQALNSRNADQRSDVYSLGCTLWYLLTGKPLYAGETMMEKIMAHRDAPIPSLREACPDAPPALDALMRRLVAKKPEERCQSMREVVVELAAGCAPTELAELAVNPRESSAGESARGMHSRTIATTPPATDRVRNRGVLLAGAGVGVLIGSTVLVLVLLGSRGQSLPSAPRTDLAATQPAAVVEPPTTPNDKPGRPVDDRWISLVSALTGKRQGGQVMEKLRELNPGLNQRRADFRQGPGNSIVIWEMDADHLTDISPLRGLPALQDLRLNGSDSGKGKLSDLAPLRELKHLSSVSCGRNPQLADLAPLQGLSLKKLAVNMTNVSDLSPLRGMPLENLDLTGAPVRDLSPLRKMPLTHLAIRRTQVEDLSPLRDLPDLQVLLVDARHERDFEVLRSIRSLRQINDTPAGVFLNRKFPAK